MSIRSWSALALGALCIAGPTIHAHADDGPWEVRLRADYLDPANKSDAIPGLAPRDAIHINSKVIPDLNIEYFFSPHWSGELVLTYPQSQTVTVAGTRIGTFKHLPPTLTAKYDFLPNAAFQPYVGAGLNLTFISNVKLAVPGVGPLTLDSTSVGPALQTGFDYKIRDHWYLNADVKWIKLGSDVDLVGVGKVSHVNIDPFLFGVGLGYRFGGSPAVSTAAGAPAPAAAPAPVPASAPAPLAATPPAPQPDSDHDGVPDSRDRCPGTPAGVKVDENGCAVDEVVLRGVNFATASAKLTPASSGVLDEVVATLQARPDSNAEIHGYTDSRGNAAYNRELSERRAQAVVDYLVAHGIDAAHLAAKGFGPLDPLASNATADGRARNRRVSIRFSKQVMR